MKYKFLCMFLASLFLFGGVFAQSLLMNILEGYDLGLDEFMEKKYITRYDMTKYLAAARCTDCLIPDEKMIQSYDTERLLETQSGLSYNIDDVTAVMPYAGENYYYCLADTVDAGYMYGYPKQTSPYCPGKFCGDSTARYIEVIESLYRLVRPYIFDTYEANWTDVADWAQENISSVPVRWISVINKRKEVCGDALCQLTTASELDVYMYYCSADMSACELPVYKTFPAGKRPSAPYTALIRAGIIPPEDSNLFTLHDFVDPTTFLSYIGGAYSLQSCIWEKDYDGDNRINSKDNCPLTYNPRQQNLDKDMLGNVCDDDIDGDGLLNPIGIVDDTNLINPRLRKETEDTSLFIPQVPTGDILEDEVGNQDEPSDSLIAEESMLALKIDALPRVGFPGLEVSFTQEYVGSLDSLTWDFGDGKKQIGLDPVHTYVTPGLYLVKATASMYGNTKIVAKLHIHVLPNIGTQEVDETGGRYTELDGGPLTGAVGELFSFDVTPINIPEEAYATMVWRCGEVGLEQTYTQNIADELEHTCVYATPGSKRVQTQLYTTDGEIYIGEMTVYVVGDTSCLDNPNIYTCDLDSDGLPDMCDDDIDGDGVFNCLYLLQFEQEDCAINDVNINATRLSACYGGIRDGSDHDICPFIEDPLQEDADGDAYGDVCDPNDSNPGIPDAGGAPGTNPGDPDGPTDPGNGGDGDGGNGGGDDDGDGVPNDQDACDTIPESQNGQQDADGCPELPDEGDDDRPSGPEIEAETCTSCPCPFADYGSELWKGDRIRALLLDENGEVIYRYTKPEIIEADIPDEMLGG